MKIIVPILFPLGSLHASINTSEINNDLITQKVTKAVLYLKNNQMSNGSIREKDSPMFEIWETVNATLAITLWKKQINFDTQNIIDRALHFLKSSENSNGMVLHNTNYRGAYCLETSSQYTLLLMKLSSPENSEVIKKINFIKKQQLPRGYWNIMSPVIPQKLQSFPSATGYALNIIFQGHQEPEDYNAAIKFLVESQNTAGNWGAEWEYYGTPFYPMLPILKALHFNASQLQNSINKAKEYLIQSQQPDGSWFYKLNNAVNIPSKELQTALAIQSCFVCGLNYDHENIFKGIDWLIHKQLPDGHWNGGYFPIPVIKQNIIKKKEDIYSTSQALIALFQYWTLKNTSPPQD